MFDPHIRLKRLLYSRPLGAEIRIYKPCMMPLPDAKRLLQSRPLGWQHVYITQFEAHIRVHGVPIFPVWVQKRFGLTSCTRSFPAAIAESSSARVAEDASSGKSCVQASHRGAYGIVGSPCESLDPPRFRFLTTATATLGDMHKVNLPA